MELPQLVVELVGDYSKLMEDIKRARVEAVKQAKFLEKDLNLKISVDDDSLKKLNQHFDLKVTHFKQTQTYFKNNPLKVYVDDNALINLNKELDKLGKKETTATDSVKNTVDSNSRVSTSFTSKNKSFDDRGNSREIITSLKAIESAVRSQKPNVITSMIGGVLRGSTENLGKQITENLFKGIIGSVEKSISGTIGSTNLFGGKLGDILVSKIGKVISGIGEDISAVVRKDINEALSKKITDMFGEMLGTENIIKEAAANRRVLTRIDEVKVVQSRDQLTLERRDRVRSRKDAELNLRSIDKDIDSNNSAYRKGSDVRNDLILRAGIEKDAEKLKEIESSISEIGDVLESLVQEEESLLKAREEAQKVLEIETKRASKARSDFNVIKPSAEIPKAYKDALTLVAGKQVAEKNIPKVVADDVRLKKSGALAGYDAVSNSLVVTQELYEAINVGKLSFEQLQVLYHELQHAVDFNFGADFKSVQAAEKSEILTSPAIPTTKEREDLQSFVTAYDPKKQVSELNAELNARRNLAKKRDEITRQNKAQEYQQGFGVNGGKLNELVNKQLDAAKKNLLDMVEFSKKKGVKLESNITEYISEIQSSREKQHTIFNQLLKAQNLELNPDDLGKLDAAIEGQLNGIELLQNRLRITQLKTIKKAKEIEEQAKLAEQLRIDNINFAVNEAKKISSGFSSAYRTLKTNLKSGDTVSSNNQAQILVDNLARAKKDIKETRLDLGADGSMGSPAGNQINQALANITRLENAIKRLNATGKINVDLSALETKDTGENLGQAISEGMEDTFDDLEGTSRKLTQVVRKATESGFEIKSPSRWGIRVGQNIGNAMETGADKSLNKFKTIIASKISEMRKGIEGISPTKFNYTTFSSTSSFPILPTSYKPSKAIPSATGMISGIPDPWTTPAGQGLPNIVSTNQRRIYPISPDPWSPPLSYTIPGTTRSGTNPNLPNTPNGIPRVPLSLQSLQNNNSFERIPTIPGISKEDLESLREANKLIEQAKQHAEDFDNKYESVGESLSARFARASESVNRFFEDIFAGRPKIDVISERFSGLFDAFNGIFTGFVAFRGFQLFSNFFQLEPSTFIKDSIEVAANFENLERQIKFTSGSISEGAKNIAFLRSEAKRLNVDLSQTLESGSKFLQATKDMPIEGYQSRQIVSAVTQASAVYGLDLDKQQRTFTALEQMSGKTVVSQEELRQQLAEAIPNASQIAANAYGTTTQSMNQLLATGRVLAEDFLPKFAQQLKAQTSSGVGDAVNSSVAITNKFNNSLIELQESIGKNSLPFRNFSLSAFASGIDLVTKNFQLLKSILLITLIKLGSPVWLMFATYLKGIEISAGGVKGALLGIGQSIATLAAQIFVLSMAMKAIDEIMMNFKDNSGAIGEQTRNVTQSINEQRKLLNPSSKVSSDDFSAFRERFTLNPFDNDTKKLKKQMEDSAKRTLEGRENTKKLLTDSNSPAIQKAIRDVQFLDKSLDNIKMERRAIIANDPGNSEALRGLQEWEKKISQMREKPLELFGGNKANLDKQVETLKTYLEYWEELKKNPKLYQSEIEEIDKIIEVTKKDLVTVTKEQDKMTKAIKNSLTEMQKFAIEIRNLEAKFNDLRQSRDTTLSLEKTKLFNLGGNGSIHPGQIEYTNNLKTQENLIGKIADNLKQIQEMSAQLEVNDLDRVLNTLNLNKGSGIDTLKAAQERAIDGSKEKEILSGFIKVKEMQIQTVDMQQQIAEQKYNLTQSLYQQTKQVADYYRAAVRESQAVGIEFEKAQKTLENPKVQNKLREALIGAGDNIYTQFIEGIINVISQTTEIEKQQLEARKQRIDYQNNVQDIQLQAVELQRSLPGKIIPIDSSIADNFNLSLKNVNSTVDEINKNINNLSNSVVDATKKADDSIKDLSKTSNSWIEGLGTKFADLVKSFENGFDRVGTAIIGMGLKTSNWLASLATGQGLIQNLAGGISAVFGEKSGQQLEQGAKEFVSNPLGALKKFYGLDNNSTPSTRLKAKGKVGFVENSSSSIDSARGHIGDDIFAPIGSKIFSPLAGTVVQSRVGGTKNTDDANPLVPGYQPQQLVIIKLDMPIEFEGKKIAHLNMRHLLDRNVQVGQKVKMGDLLGTVGEAGGRGTQFGTRNPGTARDADAAHLHIEYATSENNQRNSLPDSQASRLTAKLSKEYSGGVQNTVNTPKTSRNRQLVPKVPPVPGLDPRIDTKFLQSVATIAQSVGAKPEDLLKTMLYETGGTLSPSARNPRTKATGLIQFMPATARGLGTNIDALAQMSPQEQLVFVQKYLKQNSRGQKLDSFRKVLSTIFAGNPNASLGVGDGDITLGSYLKKAEGRYGNTARQLEQIVMQGKLIDPNSQQKLVTQASRLKLKTAAQQYQTNQTNNNLSPEQIRENELKQRLEAYRLIMSSKKTALGEISSTKDSTLGTRRTVLEGLSPNMSNAGRFSLQLKDLRRKLEKDVEALEQVIRETNGAIAQKPDLQAAFNLAMKRFPNDPKLAADAIQTNDLSFKATAFKNAEAKKNLAFLKSNIDGILKASMKDFDKKEFLRLREQDVSQQSKVIEQLQQQLQLVQKLEETDPLNPLVLNIPSLQRNISLLELTRDQYQQLVDLQKRYYEGGSKGGNMSEEALQKEFKAIFDVNSVKKEGVGLNFKYADTVRQIKYATDELTKAQTIQASQMKSLQLDNERFAIDNKDGMVSLVSLTNELTIKTNELTDAYKKQLLEIQGNTLLSPQEKLIERLKALRNYGKGKSNLEAENSYQTKLAPITNRGIELGRMEKLISSENAVSSEVMRGQGLFGIRNKELQKTQALSQIKTDFEKEKIEIHKLGLSSNYSAEEIQKLTDNLNKLNELKLDNVAKEFNMFTEAISGIKGDMDGIFKDFFMNTKSFGESISSVFQSILNNLANMASKELSNQLFSSVLGMGGKSSSGGGGGFGGIFSSLFGGLGGDGGASGMFSGGMDYSGFLDGAGGFDFGTVDLGGIPSFAKGGMVGDLLNKERAISGFNPRLIIANEGERVLTPAETKLWNQLNSSNKLESFSSGGMIGEDLGNINNVGRSGDTINITPNVNINNEGGGNINKAQFEKALEAKIQETIKQERRPGGSLNRGGLYDR